MTSRQKFGYHKYVFSLYSWFLETLSNFSFISGKKSIILFKSSRRLVWAFSGGGGGTSNVLVVSFMDVNFGFRCHLGSAQQEMPMFSPIKISWHRSEMKSPPLFRSSPLTRSLKQARLYRRWTVHRLSFSGGFWQVLSDTLFPMVFFFYFAIKCKTQGRKTIHEATNKKKLRRLRNLFRCSKRK